MKRHAVDILALGVVLVLGMLFYVPRTNPLESRYMYYADSFERAAREVNPDYTSKYRRWAWESYSPFQTLMARYTLRAFRSDLATAVTVMHVGLALSAGILAYVANRFFFGPIASLYITILLMYDRSLMPVARGLGVMTVLMLTPLLLVFIYGLSCTQDRALPRRRRVISIICLALSGGLIYSLGGHETLYAVPTLLAFAGLLCLGWLVRSVRARRRAPGPTVASLIGVASAGAVAVGLIALTCGGIAPQQKPVSFSNVLTYRDFVGKAMQDVERETGELTKDRGLLWKSTFVEGKYLTGYGRHHANTFLYPGPGFNGMLPLFVYPGFVIGLCVFGWRIARRLRARPPDSNQRSQGYFLLLNTVLLTIFVAVMLLSSDAKPTRYTPCVYVVFALSALGYQRAYALISGVVAGREPFFARLGARRRFQARRVVAGALVLVVGFFVLLRLNKNYRDLDSYIRHYACEVPTIGLSQFVAQATSSYSSSCVVIANRHVRKKAHPAVGMLLRYEDLPPNLFVINPTQKHPRIPDDAIVFIREREGWRRGDASEVN
jgi:hypothetical protein